MLRFFRILRKKFIEEQKVRQYVYYAIGEIFLVVIGILIALQINNWNEERLSNKYEITMLRELDNALYNDSLLVADVFEWRMDRKAEGVDAFKELILKQSTISEVDFRTLYGQMGTNFTYRFNSGPYETIKSNGLNQISNDSLRSYLVNAYEMQFPAYQGFMVYVRDENDRLIAELEPDFLKYEVAKIDTSSGIFRNPNGTDVLNHPSFMRVLFLENEKRRDAESRMRALKRIRLEIHNRIREELKNRGDD